MNGGAHDPNLGDDGAHPGRWNYNTLSPNALDTILEHLERSHAHSGFNADNTRRLYALLDLCQGQDHARQALRALGMLVHLHYCENDEFELRERSREGIRLARQLGDDRALRRFLGYASLADRMRRDFQRSWAGLIVLLALGTLGAASYAFRGLLLQRTR